MYRIIILITLWTIFGSHIANAQNTASNPSFPSTDTLVRHIYMEGMYRSHAEALAQVLLDSIGPRLTGSPANHAANDWLMRTYTSWGIPARNERYGTWRKWSRGQSHINLIAPRVRTLEATALAWSPATAAGGVTGNVIALPTASETDDAKLFANWLRTVRGSFVLVTAPRLTCRPDSSWTAIALPESYQAMRVVRDSADAEWRSRRAAIGQSGKPLYDQLEGAGVAGILTSRWIGEWGADMIMDTKATVAPVFDVSCEDYGLLARLAMHNQHPRIHAVADMHMAPDEVPVYNTIAELKGTEHPEQYVILSAHQDSWDSGSGATDNGMGTIVMLEAMRILKLTYPHPKRTILVGHWSGEEEGEIGSNAFAEDHPEVLRGLQTLLNEDDGAARINHVVTFGFLDAHAAFARWMGQFPSSLTDSIKIDNPGLPQEDGSDDDAFTCRDAPGFALDQVERESNYTYHTNKDTFDKLSFNEIKRNATLVALLAYEASEDPQQLSRARNNGNRQPRCSPALRSWAALWKR